MKSFSLIYKVLLISFGYFTAFVLSCSPDSNDGNPISISLSTSKSWRVNIPFGTINPPQPLVMFNSGSQPDYNEIFLLGRPKPVVPGVYEIIPFEQFYRTTAIGNSDAVFFTQFRNDGENQKFTFECDFCNLQTNAANWTQYHTLCFIKNVASGLCMTGAASVSNVTQTNCAIASKWDIFGRQPPEQNIVTSNCATPATSTASSLPLTTSNIQLSAGGLAGVIFGTITATTLVTLVIGYLFIQRRQQFAVKEKDRVNVQFYN